MLRKEENPAALAGADRAGVTMLTSNVDDEDATPSVLDQQLCKVLRRYVLSLPLASVIAEHAFASGRRR